MLSRLAPDLDVSKMKFMTGTEATVAGKCGVDMECFIWQESLMCV